MNYIILDLEWNQAMNSSLTVRTPVVLYGEIIQIGAVKTDENFNLVDKLKINVKPKFYKKMNPYVEKITGITAAELSDCETFPEAFRRFSEWCGEEFRVITWGFDDIGIFCDNLRAHGENAVFGRNYINLQLIFNRQTASEHLQCALSSAAEKLGIPIDVQVHDAANDAFLTYEVLKKLDMIKGIAEYAEMSSTAASVPIVKEYFDRADGDNIVRDRRVNELLCPVCDKKTKQREWLFSNKRACRTLAECDEHGTFLVKLKAARITDKNYTITRSVFNAGEEDIASYERKLRKKKEAAERRKNAEKNSRRAKMKKNTILFDMDGTLVPFVSEDFLKLYFMGLTKKLLPLGYEPKKAIDDLWAGTAAMVKNDGSRLNSEAFWETFRARNAELPDAKPFCDDFYVNEFDETKASLRENRDLKPMISRLKNAGFELILSTNSVFPLTAMKTRLKWVNLDESDFLLITNYDNSSFCKPNPKYFAEILEKTGKTADECIVVGNSVKEDILPAKSLGIAAFWVNDYPENPDNADVSSFDRGSIADAEKFLLNLV